MNKDLLNITGSFISTELDFIEKCQKRKEELQQENQQLKDQLKQRDEVIDKLEKHIKSLSSKGRDCMIYEDVKKDILDILNKYKGIDIESTVKYH